MFSECSVFSADPDKYNVKSHVLALAAVHQHLFLKLLYCVQHPSHLLAFTLSEQPVHGCIQFCELTECVADVPVKVLVLLILVVENGPILFPFFHTADLWVFAVRMHFRRQSSGLFCVFVFLQSRHFVFGRPLLTWCSLLWWSCWACIQSLCSVSRRSRGVQVSPQTGSLLSEVCLFHLWMIFSFFLEDLVGWAVEKQITKQNKCKIPMKFTHFTLKSCLRYSTHQGLETLPFTILGSFEKKILNLYGSTW